MPPAAAEPVETPSPSFSADSDAELADAFLLRNQYSALVELVRRHQIPLFRKLAVELADPDDAEALCEAVFVVASQRLAEWPRTADFRGWLFGVSEEVAALRKSERPDPESPRLVDPSAYFRECVHRALHSLDPEDRAVLVALDLEGLSVEQVAQDRNDSVDRVTEALTRARARFSAAMTEPVAPAAPTRPAPARPRPGEIIDKRYRVESLLGEGGMAAVFRAEHLAIKRKVALKTLHPTRQTQAMIRERFTREAEVLGRLAHPNFVNVSDFGESRRGMAYLVMELLNGRPLSAELRAVGRLHPARALRIVRQVCSGLEFAHQIGIIHRDIKPDNVIVLDDERAEGFAKILDLGVAATEDHPEPNDQTIYGTPEYMAPEQLLGGHIDGRVDLYAVGIMLYELLTGDVPFSGGTIQYVLAQHLTADPPRLEASGLALEEMPELQRLLDACLAKKPDERIASAELLGREIDALLVRFGDVPAPRASNPGTSWAPRATPELPAPLPRSNRMPWYVAGAVLCLGAAVLLWWVLR